MWGMPLHHDLHIMPKQPRFMSNDIYSELALVLAGQSCALISDYVCQDYLKRGELVELFADLAHHEWTLYLYRPVRTPTSPRVLMVYDWLKEILLAVFARHNYAS